MCHKAKYQEGKAMRDRVRIRIELADKEARSEETR